MSKKIEIIDEEDDDKPVGRVLSRREMLAMLGGAGAAFFVATGFKNLRVGQNTTTPTPTFSCVVKPEMTEGPYFVDDMLNRSDIRIDPTDDSIKAGIPLKIKFVVSDVSANACTPISGAQIDVWNCDALGVYSGVSDAGFDTVGQKWLRGYQLTDAEGAAEFTTIYPGWYSGRTVHIHFKIRTEPESETGYEFTSQLFVDDELTDTIYKQEPYAEHSGERDTRNDSDMHYANGGDQLVLDLVEDEDGYTAAFTIGLDLTDEAAGATDSFSAQMGGGAPPNGAAPAGRPNATPTTSG